MIFALLAMSLTGCDGCDGPNNRQGVRPKTSMAGQPEEYLDATRLDAKEDSALPSKSDSDSATADNPLDSIEIVSDSSEWVYEDTTNQLVSDSIEEVSVEKSESFTQPESFQKLPEPESKQGPN